MTKQIITISGDPGSGKSTIAKELAKIFKAKRIYVGEIRRKLAKEKGMTLEELNKYAEKHPETDVDVDEQVASHARKLSQKQNVIVEGRTQFHFLPESIKIYIKVSLNEATDRIWHDLQKQKSKEARNEGDIDSYAELKKSIKQRINCDIKRYKKYYNIDHTNESHYDLVIDTTNLTKKEAIKTTINKVKDLIKSD